MGRTTISMVGAGEVPPPVVGRLGRKIFAPLETDSMPMDYSRDVRPTGLRQLIGYLNRSNSSKYNPPTGR